MGLYVKRAGRLPSGFSFLSVACWAVAIAKSDSVVGSEGKRLLEVGCRLTCRKNRGNIACIHVEALGSLTIRLKLYSFRKWQFVPKQKLCAPTTHSGPSHAFGSTNPSTNVYCKSHWSHTVFKPNLMPLKEPVTLQLRYQSPQKSSS